MNITQHSSKERERDMTRKRKQQSKRGENLTSSPTRKRKQQSKGGENLTSKRRRGREKEKGGGNDPKTCSICLREEGRVARGQIDCCDHYVCFVCIMEWAKKESLCPMCKQRFRSVDRPPKDGAFACERIVRVPLRDQVHHPLQNVTSGPSNQHAHACCSECHSSEDENHLLHCDLCNSAAHTYCVGFGVNVPESDWYCHDCTISRNEYAENEVSSSTRASSRRLSFSMFHVRKEEEGLGKLNNEEDRCRSMCSSTQKPWAQMEKTFSINFLFRLIIIIFEKTPLPLFFPQKETIFGSLNRNKRYRPCLE